MRQTPQHSKGKRGREEEEEEEDQWTYYFSAYYCICLYILIYFCIYV